MAKERKKAEPKPIIKAEPKKRDVKEVVETVKPIPKKVVKTELKVEPKVEEQPEVKPKRAENKYVRIALDAKGEERTAIAEKVKSGELKYAFYATDGDKGYHHYLIIKKQK